MAKRADVPDITLNNGVKMPQLGLGVWQTTNEQAEALVRFALAEAGYRHIDTAKAYGNEEGVGRGIATSGVPREEIFLTTKLWNADQGYDSTLRAFDESLKRLGTDYVNLYLIHWPLPKKGTFLDTWKALEHIYHEGRAKAIGVCNNKPHHLQQIFDHGTVVPAVNQIELHPHFPQYLTQTFNTSRGIATEAWSPLGGTSKSGWGGKSKPNTLLQDPELKRIGAKYGKSAAQIMIRWHLESGHIVIPKSTHEERIRQNIDVFDFKLTGEDFEAIAALDNEQRVGFDPDDFN